MVMPTWGTSILGRRAFYGSPALVVCDWSTTNSKTIKSEEVNRGWINLKYRCWWHRVIELWASQHLRHSGESIRLFSSYLILKSYRINLKRYWILERMYWVDNFQHDSDEAHEIVPGAAPELCNRPGQYHCYPHHAQQLGVHWSFFP